MTGSPAERRADTWLRAWDSQGLHRTGTAGDEAGAQWLASEVESIGARATMETFPLDRIDTEGAYVDIDGERFCGEKLFDAPDTGGDGVSGPLATAPGPGRVQPLNYHRLRSTARIFPHFAVRPLAARSSSLPAGSGRGATGARPAQRRVVHRAVRPTGPPTAEYRPGTSAGGGTPRGRVQGRSDEPTHADRGGAHALVVRR